MKKFFSIILGIFLCIFQIITFLTLAHAQTTSNDFSRYFLPDTAIYIKASSLGTHPFGNLLQEISNNSPENVLLDLLKSLPPQTEIAFALSFDKSDHSPIFFVAFQVDSQNFDNLIKQKKNEILQENLGLQRTIYSQDNYFLMRDGSNVILSNRKGLISDLLLTQNTNNLGKTAGFTESKENNLNNNFLNLYVNYQELGKQMPFPPGIYFGKPFHNFSWEGISIAQTNRGFEISDRVKLNTEITNKIGHDPQKYQFTPELYKNINAANLMFYEEIYNFKDQLKDTIRLISIETADTDENAGAKNALSEVETSFKETFNLNLDDFLSSFSGKTALIVHADLHQTYPALSIVSRVDSNNAQAKNNLTTLATSIQTRTNEALKQARPDLSAENLQKLMVLNKTNFNGTEFIQLIIDPAIVYGNVPSSPTSPKDLIHLNMGITSDGFLVISTLRNPLDLITSDVGSLMKDPNLTKDHPNTQQRVNDITYINFRNIHTYINAFHAVASLPGEAKSEIDKILEPLNYLFASTTSNSDTYMTKSHLVMDMSKLKQYENLGKGLEQMVLNFGMRPDTVDQNDQQNTSTNSNVTPKQDQNQDQSHNQQQHNLQPTFSDIRDSDWFYAPVKDLAEKGIMLGNRSTSSQTEWNFNPHEKITRGEYIQALMAAQNYLNISHAATEQKLFTDVSADSAYASAINQARSYGIVKGFDDNTFRPDQNLTRAEAVQILFNATQRLKTNLPAINLPFEDVKSDHWFHNAVALAFHHQIVNGKDAKHFAPADLMTRAEAAKIISKYIEAESVNLIQTQ